MNFDQFFYIRFILEKKIMQRYTQKNEHIDPFQITLVLNLNKPKYNRNSKNCRKLQKSERERREENKIECVLYK